MIAILTTLGVGRVVSTHTDFHSSTPTDGALVDGPLSQITVNFTNPAPPAGEGFELLVRAWPTRSASEPSTSSGASSSWRRLQTGSAPSTPEANQVGD